MCYDKEIASSLQIEGTETHRLELPISEMPSEKGLEEAVFWEYSWDSFCNCLFTNPVCVNI